ncbi:unnamed protein product [Amoebophrya sp. A25]|nr:unnamed protein product [Amoebophrya sp. A25]|eukprot:GSA25T00011622001.1
MIAKFKSKMYLTKLLHRASKFVIEEIISTMSCSVPITNSKVTRSSLDVRNQLHSSWRNQLHFS